MKASSWLACVALLLGSFAELSPACGDELVQVAPHRAAVWPAANDATPPLMGFLAHPQGGGRFPAVVLLHGCSGFATHETQAAAKLKSWGYVALAVDSLGNANMCQAPGGSAAEAIDAYAALRYLSALDFVDPDNVAVMGYSMGGTAVLTAGEQGSLQEMQNEHFRAGIAYYPTCETSSGIMSLPTLILIGDKDDWTPAKACGDMAEHRDDIGITRPRQGGAPVTLVVYPEATHAFDWDFPAQRYLGHFMKYDPMAARDAEFRVRTFLHDTLRQRPAEP